MPKHTGKLQAIMRQSAQQLSDASFKEAKSQYDYLRKAIKEREKGFAKKNKQGAFDRKYGITPIPSLRGMDEAEVKRGIKRMIEKLSGEKATASGLMKALERESNNRHNRLETLLGHELSDTEYDSIGKFLGEMQKRHGMNWKYVSDDYLEVADFEEFNPDNYDESILNYNAERLGLKREQFKRNYDYWLAHADDLMDATPIQGRKRKLTPSDYIRSEGLPTIKSWRARQKKK